MVISLPNLAKSYGFNQFRGGVEKVIDDFEVLARKRWHALKRKKKPRDTYREWLKQLGVMRLKDKLKSWPAILDYARDEL